MTFRRCPQSAVAALLLAASVGALSLAACNRTAATRTDVSSAKPPCVGCSVDGKTTPRTPDGHPDLNGYWNGAAPNPNAPARGNAGGGAGAGRVMNRYPDGSIVFDFSTEYNEDNGVGRLCQDDSCQDKNQPPYNAEWMQKVRKIAATEFGGTTPLDPVHDCRPLGVPRAGVNGIHMVQTPQVIAILYEAAPYSTFRLIYTDGREHPKDLESSFWGHSIGHWEGDTLVADVVGLSDETWLGGGGAVGRSMYTSVHSEKEHVIERWTRNGDAMTYEATVEDPVALAKPWVITPRRVRHAGREEELVESICTANFKEHFVAPRPDDPDIRKKCGYRCEDDTPK
jgi:hypothetical protein